MKTVALFSYVVASDSGFAPNPFWGTCSLATCKPQIRRTAHVGDWIAGISPRASGNRLVYAMRVTDKLPIAAYWSDPRFTAKRPDMSAAGPLPKSGDNIYAPDAESSGGFRQLPSGHSYGIEENPQHKRRDLAGMYVLVSDRYWYFGATGPELPPSLEFMKVGRGHRNRFPSSVIDAFTAFIADLPAGVNGPPTRWPAGDTSWASASAR
jgi:hypothetical protein